MENGKLTGVTGVLGTLTGDGGAPSTRPVQVESTPKPQPPVSTPAAPKSPERPAAEPPRNKTEKPSRASTPVARLGRPPGRNSGTTPLKKKATLWVSAALMDEYTDWSWDERCNLGELIERALLDYKQRRRRSPAPTAQTERN